MSEPARHVLRLRRPAAALLALLALGLSGVLWSAQDATLADAIAEQRQRAFGSDASAEALNDLGNLLVLDQQNQAAIDAYRRALELDPAHLASGFNLGLLLDSSGQVEEALEVLESILEMHPDHARTQYQVGYLLERAGRASDAVDAYARAFGLDPFLAMPDVNPQITDNELVMEALLRVEVEPEAQDQAARIYSEPSKIASLLMPSESEAAVAETPPETPTAEPTGETVEDNPAVMRSLGIESVERDLGPDDLRAAPRAETVSETPEVTRAQSSRMARPRPAAEDEAPVASPEPVVEEPEERPSRTLSVDDLSSARVNQATPATAGTSRRGSARRPSTRSTRQPTTSRSRSTAPSRPRSSSPTRFRPGRRSSAQLDLRLVPQTPQPASPAARAGR